MGAKAPHTQNKGLGALPQKIVGIQLNIGLRYIGLDMTRETTVGLQIYM